MDSINSSQKGLSFYKLLLRCILFTFIFCIVSVSLVIVLSCIFYGTQNPTAKIQLLGYIGLYFSVFLTSFIMTRTNGEKWLLGGLILGAMIFLLTFFLSIFINDIPNSNSMIFRFLIIASSSVSAFIARRRSNKNRKPRKLRVR